jgi:hypothetical protein
MSTTYTEEDLKGHGLDTAVPPNEKGEPLSGEELMKHAELMLNKIGIHNVSVVVLPTEDGKNILKIVTW